MYGEFEIFFEVFGGGVVVCCDFGGVDYGG